MAPAATPAAASKDDLCTMDEVRVFKDEGENEEEEFREELHEDLFDEDEAGPSKGDPGGKADRPVDPAVAAYGAFRPPFPLGGYPGGLGYSPYLPPPPAHLGPALRAPLGYPGLPPQYSPYPPPYGMDQLAAWHQMSLYHQRAPHFPPGLGGLPPPPVPGSEAAGPPFFPGVTGQFGVKQEEEAGMTGLHRPAENKENIAQRKEAHIKKPLNAFMLYMKEMRPVVQAECTLKESAAINQILGRRWHGLSREEQAKYYEKAREERQRHMQLYPNWNARDNYRYGHKKKRKREKTDDPAANIKKCRARYGVEQPDLWCKPCKRKKKCVRVQRYLAGESEQEIDADFQPGAEGEEEGGPGGGGEEDQFDSDGEDSSQGGSRLSSERTPNSPLDDLSSIPSLASPMNLAGFSDELQHNNEAYKIQNFRPVGADPRCSKNPLSISSLTASSSEESGPVTPAGLW